MRAATFAHMNTFFKSGRYLFWLAAFAITVGATLYCEDSGRDKLSSLGAGLFAGGVLLWLRGKTIEDRFVQVQRRNRSAAPVPPDTI